VTKISVRNFQSIKSIDFEINGFTVIVGKNNIGKSAVIRAIDAALTNQAGTNYIREGEKESKVTIEKKNTKIEWKKGDSSIYKINGETFSKLNRNIPQPLIDAGFGRMDIGDQKVSPYIAHQFDPIFLLDKPGSVVTEVLASLYNLNILNTADELCQKELKGNKNILKTREADIIGLKDKLEKFKDFEGIKKTVEYLVDLENNCDKLKNEISELATFIERLEKIAANIQRLKTVKDIKIPNSVPVSNLINDFQYLSQKENEVSGLQNKINKLKGISKIAIPAPIDLSGSIMEVNQIDTWILSIIKFKEKMMRYRNLESINLVGLKENISDLEKEMVLFSDLKTIEGTFISAASLAKASRTTLVETQSKLDQAKQEMSSFKVCPLCERPL